jgi:hypothetical protein
LQEDHCLARAIKDGNTTSELIRFPIQAQFETRESPFLTLRGYGVFSVKKCVAHKNEKQSLRLQLGAIPFV